MICLQHLARACSDQYIGQLLFSVKFRVKHNGKSICSKRKSALMNRKYIHSPIVTNCKLQVHDISAQRKHFLGALIVLYVGASHVASDVNSLLLECHALGYNYLITKHSIKLKNISAMYSVVAKHHMSVLNYNLTDNLTLIYMLCIGFARQEIW